MSAMLGSSRRMRTRRPPQEEQRQVTNGESHAHLGSGRLLAGADMISDTSAIAICRPREESFIAPRRHPALRCATDVSSFSEVMDAAPDSSDNRLVDRRGFLPAITRRAAIGRLTRYAVHGRPVDQRHKPPIEDSAFLVVGDKIVKVGKRSEYKLPRAPARRPGREKVIPALWRPRSRRVPEDASFERPITQGRPSSTS
jgi:hypothetical protein